MMDRETVRNMYSPNPKKIINKFEILVHLIGFIITAYHDARSSKYQNYIFYFFNHRKYPKSRTANLVKGMIFIR